MRLFAKLPTWQQALIGAVIVQVLSSAIGLVAGALTAQASSREHPGASGFNLAAVFFLTAAPVYIMMILALPALLFTRGKRLFPGIFLLVSPIPFMNFFAWIDETIPALGPYGWLVSTLVAMLLFQTLSLTWLFQRADRSNNLQTNKQSACGPLHPGDSA